MQMSDGRFVYDEGQRILEGIETGTGYQSGMRLDLRVAEANPITGALRFELPQGEARPLVDRRDRVHRGRRVGQSRVPKGIKRGGR